MRRKTLGLLLALTMVATACTAADTTTTAATSDTTTATSTTEPATTAAGSTLVVAETTPPVTFDPTQSALIKTWLPWQLVFDSLILQQPDGSFEPRLATEWTISDDGLTYTFNLREGVTFHNGEPFEADDVVYTFERGKEVGIPYAQARIGVIETVTALDERTVEIVLSQFDSGFLNNLANTYPVASAMLNREAGATSDPALFMVGTGPFRMVSYAPERELVLEKNGDYWDEGRPHVDNLIIRYMPEQQAQLAALQAGDIDLMFPTPESVLVLESDSNVTLAEVTSANVVRINVNSSRPPLDNVDVRRAMALAIDRQAMVDGALLGEGKPASYIPEAYAWAVGPDDQPYSTQDIDEARRLLAEAGYPDGFDIELMHLAGYGSYLDRFVEILADQLSEVGINATIVPQEQATWLDRLLTANYDITDNEFSFQADPFQYLRVRRERQGPAPAIIDELEAAALAAGPDELVGILTEMATTQADLVYPDIPIMARVAFTAYRNNVVGVSQDFTNSYRFLVDVGKDG